MRQPDDVVTLNTTHSTFVLYVANSDLSYIIQFNVGKDTPIWYIRKSVELKYGRNPLKLFQNNVLLNDNMTASQLDPQQYIIVTE